LLAAWPDLGSAWLIVWFWITALLGVVWFKRHLDIARGQREPILAATDAVTPDDALPPLSVLVAAKEEKENIGRCLGGLAAQRSPRLQIVAINDRSVDRTGAIMDAAAADEPRLTPVHVTELPAGWFGKNNAMRCGIERASGEWLCFTDADCRFHAPELLSAAMSFALRHNVEFLSVLPRLEADTFWERVVQPVAGAIMVYWNPPQRVNDPRCRAAYANGAFMLMSRRAYDAIGGHDAVKATLNEDMHMARRAKAAGVRFRVIRGGDLYSVRMYTGMRQIWRGWSRIFYGCFGTLPRLAASFLLLLIASLSPYVTLATSPLTGPAAPWLAGAAAWAIVGQQSIMWRFYPLSGLPARYALTYPLGTVLCLGMILNAVSRALGATRTTWRGTTYQGGSR
jgi:chlorobactene glucosyltransferase